jgi:hypothetical protein
VLKIEVVMIQGKIRRGLDLLLPRVYLSISSFEVDNNKATNDPSTPGTYLHNMTQIPLFNPLSSLTFRG